MHCQGPSPRLAVGLVRVRPLLSRRLRGEWIYHAEVATHIGEAPWKHYNAWHVARHGMAIGRDGLVRGHGRTVHSSRNRGWGEGNFSRHRGPPSRLSVLGTRAHGWPLARYLKVSI